MTGKLMDMKISHAFTLFLICLRPINGTVCTCCLCILDTHVLHMQRHKFCNVVSGDTVVCSTFCYAEMTIALC